MDLSRSIGIFNMGGLDRLISWVIFYLGAGIPVGGSSRDWITDVLPCPRSLNDRIGLINIFDSLRGAG